MSLSPDNDLIETLRRETGTTNIPLVTKPEEFLYGDVIACDQTFTIVGKSNDESIEKTIGVVISNNNEMIVFETNMTNIPFTRVSYTSLEKKKFQLLYRPQSLSDIKEIRKLVVANISVGRNEDWTKDFFNKLRTWIIENDK